MNRDVHIHSLRLSLTLFSAFQIKNITIASDITKIVNGILSTEIQNDGLDFIIRFNGRKFAISSERRIAALKQAIDWKRPGVPLFLDDAFDNMPHNLREHG